MIPIVASHVYRHPCTRQRAVSDEPRSVRAPSVPLPDRDSVTGEVTSNGVGDSAEDPGGFAAARDAGIIRRLERGRKADSPRWKGSISQEPNFSCTSWADQTQTSREYWH